MHEGLRHGHMCVAKKAEIEEPDVPEFLIPECIFKRIAKKG